MAKNSATDPHVSSSEPEKDRTQSKPYPNPIRDKMLDKTLADSFPTSDPPSSIPDPAEDSFCEDDAA